MQQPPSEGPSRSTVALLIALAMVPYFVNLATPPLWDANESLYAQPPKEVLDWPEGDFLAPTWNAKPYFAHPPLSTWVTVPFYAIFGSSELGHRLPMALGALLVVLATYRLGRYAGGARIGLLAALVLAATPRFWLFSRQLSGDVYFVAVLTWAYALALPVVAGGGRPRSLRIANVLVGLGFLAKGPVILVLYGGGLLLAWLFGRPRAPLAELRPVRGLLLILAVGSVWFVYMSVRYQELNFFGQYFGHYTFGRVAGSIGQRGVLWYLQTLIGDAQPWICVLPFGVAMAVRGDRRVSTLLPLAVIGWTLVFFTLSAGKRQVYMLPVYPMIALAIAPVGVAVIEGASRWSARLAGLAAAFGCLVTALLLYLLGRNVPLLRPEINWPLGVFAFLAVPMALSGVWGRGRQVTYGAIGGLLLVQTAAALALPALARFRPVPGFAQRIRAEQSAENPEPAIKFRVPAHSLNFYLDRPTRTAGTPEDLRAKMEDRRVAFLLIPEHRFDWPGKDPAGPRVGLKHDMPEALFDELSRAPLLGFNFGRNILGHGGPPARHLLLLRITLPGKRDE